MAESRLRIGGQGPLSPQDVASRTFPIVRRGFDVASVHEFLDSAGAELNRLRDRIEELEDELAEARAPGQQPPLDIATLTAALGEETARVLRTAQEAGADLKARAEEAAARTLKEANEEAARLRSSAETLLEDRTAEADALTARVRAEVEAEVEALRERAAAEAAALRDNAAAEAENVVREAIDRGRQMVNEAQAARERMIGDLARRRKAGIIQVEQLRAGRDRLLDAYRAVRTSLDEITAELEHAEVESRLAGEAAARRMAAETPDTLEPEEVAAAALPAHVGTGPHTASGSARGDEDDAFASGAVVQPMPTGGDKGPVGALPNDAVGEAPPGSRETLPVERPSSAPELDALFARIKADRAEHETDDFQLEGQREAEAARIERAEGRDAETPPLASDEQEGDDVNEVVAVAEAVVAAEATLVPEVTSQATADPGSARTDADERLLLQRDEAVDALAVALTKKLKRLLQDEQNMVLDRLRKHRGKLTAEAILPDETEHTSRYVDAAVDTLTEAEQAGVSMAGNFGPVKSSRQPDVKEINAMATTLAAELIEPLRIRLTRSMHDSGADDPTTVTDLVGAAYRELKSRRIERAVGDQLTAALTLGIRRALPAGTRVRWIVDDADGPCPDCDDNALAGGVALGEPFPTGQLGPPAHSGCRCLLGPPSA